MKTFISLLRGVNVSGQNKIRMAELSSLYESLGLVKVQTYVQSGNVVFDSLEADGSNLAELIEAQIEQRFGYAVPVFVRDQRNFQRIVENNPFWNDRKEEPTRLHVTFLYRCPAESELSNLITPNQNADEFFVGEQEIFLFCPNGYGRTKLSNNFFEKKFKAPATTRNWKTVQALYTMAHDR